MARSEEAIIKRALKRERTEDEQRRADRTDMYKQQEKKAKQEQEAKRLRSTAPSYYGPTSTTIKLKKDNSKTTTIKSTPTQQPSKKASNMDFKDHRQRENQRPAPQKNLDGTTTTNDEDAMKEPGAWICPKCSNSNFASRRYCNSKTCDEPRPFDADYNMREKKNTIEKSSIRHRSLRNTSSASRPTKVQRHDEETSKKLVWAEQADPTKLSKNQELRQRFLESGGEGMTQEDIDRAKILLARDERKKSKNNKTKRTSKASSAIETKSESNNTSSSSALGDDANNSDSKKEPVEEKHIATNEELNQQEDNINNQENTKQQREPKKSNDSKSKRDQNAALRRLYLETNGKGMKPDQIERAKLLITRDERKKQRKSEKMSSKQ
jgi:hypothetical protein